LNIQATYDAEVESPGPPAQLGTERDRAALWALFRNCLPLLLAIAAIGAWYSSLGSIHPYRATAIGLVSQLSAFWWLSVVFASTAIVLELKRASPRTTVMIPLLVALALILHGTLPATESVPRFSSAYVVAGFSQYIGQTGHALPRLDVRMSWPALFAAAGMAARGMGVSTVWFLKWCPFVLNLALLVPLKSIANTCLRTSRARWAALAIFMASNWIDQDYFSPQGINLFLFLAAIAIVIRVFAIGGYPPRPVQTFLRSRTWRRIKELTVRALQLPYCVVGYEQPEQTTTVRHRLAMLTVLVTILTTSAVTHQITPAALCLVFFALSVTGRTNLRMLWVLMAVLVWAWLSWEAHTFWSNHLSKVFGSAGQVGSTIDTAVAARLQGTTLARSLVEQGRVVAAVVTWIGALSGSWALWRRGRTMWSMMIVAVAPIAVAGAVSYGGEVALRILLFSLAPAAVLTASLIDYQPLRRGSALFCLGIAVTLLALFPLDRYGNEMFEAITPGELAAATWIHAHVPGGAWVYIADRDEPLYYTNPGSYKLLEFGGLLSLTGHELAQHLPNTRVPTYIYLTRAQANYGSDYLGYPTAWLSDFKSQLLKTGYVHVVYRNSTAVVMRIEKAPPSRHPPTIVRRHPRPPVTPRPKPVPVVHIPPPRPPAHVRTPPTTHPPVKKPKLPPSATSTSTTTTTTSPSTTGPTSVTTIP